MANRDKEKNKEYQHKWYLKNVEKQREKVRITKLNRRARYHSYKSSLKCELCGENHPSCIDFHHIDSNVKEVDISRAATHLSWGKLMEEIAKCKVICSNCHRKIHWEQRKENITP